MKIIASLTIVTALFVSQTTMAQAPGSPGTAGAGNAAATSGAMGGGTPSQPGTGPGETKGHDIEEFGAEWYLLTPEGEKAED